MLCAQLAGPRNKLTMFCAALARDETGNWDVIWRVNKTKRCLFFSEQLVDEGLIAGVATANPMRPTIPNVPGRRNGKLLWGWDFPLFLDDIELLDVDVEKPVDFDGVEARQFQVETNRNEELKVRVKHFIVPPRVAGDPIKREPERLDLRLGVVGHYNNSNFIVSQRLHGLPNGMSIDNFIFAINDNGHYLPVVPDHLLQLRLLRLFVHARPSGILLNRIDWDSLPLRYVMNYVHLLLVPRS